MADMAEFERRIRIYAAKVGKVGDEAVRTVASATLRSLAYDTPVDTGLAVSNWQVGLGTAPSAERPAYSVGERGSTAETNRLAVIQAGSTVINGYTSGSGAAVHIVNNAKHIGALNDGHSKQAPSNFVETALLNGRASVRGLRISLK